MMPKKPSNFFTPPRVPRVNLHIASIWGGPTHFRGETPDKRDVYIRYRGGYLSIDVATQPGSTVSDRVKLLNIQLGPPLDYSMSLKTLVALTGVLVDEGNATFPLAEDEELDFSGATTYWRAYRFSTTRTGAAALLSTCSREFPGCELFEVTYTAQWERKRTVLKPGVVPKSSCLELLFGKDGPTVSLDCRAFDNSMSGYGGHGDDETLSSKAGRKIETVGSRDCALKFDNLSLFSEFLTDDVHAREILKRMDTILEFSFPLTEYTSHDLASGSAVTGDVEYHYDDPAIPEWVHAFPNRFRSVVPVSMVGYR